MLEKIGIEAKQPNSAIRKCVRGRSSRTARDRRVRAARLAIGVDENDEVLIAGFGRKGHAVGDIPGVRFKVVKVSGPSRSSRSTARAGSHGPQRVEVSLMDFGRGRRAGIAIGRRPVARRNVIANSAGGECSRPRAGAAGRPRRRSPTGATSRVWQLASVYCCVRAGRRPSTPFARTLAFVWGRCVEPQPSGRPAAAVRRNGRCARQSAHASLAF